MRNEDEVVNDVEELKRKESYASDGTDVDDSHCENIDNQMTRREMTLKR